MLKEFFSLLGPDLKAVTGDSEQIDMVTDKVKECVGKLEQFPNDVFNQEYEENWKLMFEGFNHSIGQIEDDTINMINTTFKEKLTSSEGAFDLLNKFKNIMTRKKIDEQLKQKYDNVLETYEKEVDEMDQLFNKGKDNPPISKNMPPNAGAIAWARSIMGRIKTPIYKFKTRQELLFSSNGKQITKKYIALAKKLDVGYEKEKFDAWIGKNTTVAIDLLKKNILEEKEDGYHVNFDP